MNNTSHLYKKIFSGFNVSWDIEELEDKFESITLDKYYRIPYSDPNNRTHWQFYNSGIAFLRNFHINFKEECNEVVAKLQNQQRILSISPDVDNPLITEFLKTDLRPGKVTIIKILPNSDVKKHVDITRNVCLNIGLKRSNKWNTIIGDTCIEEEYDPEHSPSYTINDGDGYLMLVKNVHSVVCNDPANLLPRYVMTIHLSTRSI